MIESVSIGLYWALPGPSEFIRKIAEGVQHARAIAMNIPTNTIPDLWGAISLGIRHGHVEDPIELRISDGSDIPSLVGAHFKMRFTTGLQLARHIGSSKRAVLLRPESPAAKGVCDTYFKVFLEGLEHSAGNVCLLMISHAEDLREERSDDQIRLICFDGALVPSEITAYVAMRMVDRSGPGSTTLLRSLVTEFSGYDPGLAEQLIRLDDDALLRLPESLSTIMDMEPGRWRHSRWLDGTMACIAGIDTVHPLHEWHAASHQGRDKAKAIAAARRRYWVASLRALLPWLEERRRHVIDILRIPIQKTLAQTGGKHRRQLGTGKVVETEYDELEYNNVVGLARHEGLLIPQDAVSGLAYSVCETAKSVRDDLAHLRPPRVEQVLKLVRDMDRLLYGNA